MPTTLRIRIGTRRSDLAMAQSGLAAERIRAAAPHAEVELVPILTRGDREKGPLADIGGKGLFTAELEAALRRGEIHLAVHSAKDMPADMPDGLALAAVLERADARDALVSPGGGGLESLPRGASVGTSSLRRRAQVLAARGDLTVAPIRGNVGTRLRRALGEAVEGRVDAVVLAMAGLARSGLAETHRANIRPLDIEEFIPAGGQGCIAIQTPAASRGPHAEDLAEILDCLDHTPSHHALLAERAVLRGLGAGCHSCLAVHILERGGRWRGIAMVARSDGTGMIRSRSTGRDATEAAESLLVDLCGQGAIELLGTQAPARPESGPGNGLDNFG